MDDSISRQAAIKAIEKLNIPEDMCVFEILSHIMLVIATLPSAQPDIIRCKDCKYYRQEIDMCEEPHSTAHNVVHEDDYCSRRKRKQNDRTGN